LLAGAGAWALPALADDPVLEEVVITGSRVIKNGDSSPTPVTVLETQDIQKVQPTTLADGLNLMPVFAGSRGQFSNPSATGGVGGGNGVASQLNLRNIGSYRNLILFDGHRVPPTSITGIVDIDMIPQALIQRVDTVTGGVSAVYGSDAVTGVINFVTNRNFNGIASHAQYGESEHSDGEASNAGVVFGTDLFDGRGHFEASYEYRNDKGILYRSARSWSNQWIVGGTGTAANPFVLLENGRISNQPFGGLISTGVLTGQNFAANGVLTPFANGASAGAANRQIGGDGGYNDTSMKAPLESHQLFGRFDLDFTDQLHGYFVAAANLKTNEFYADTMALNNVTLSSQNAFLPATYRSQLATAGQTTFRLGKLVQSVRFHPEADSDQYFFNTGLEGKLGSYDWTLSLTRGSTKLTTTLQDNVNEERLSAALDAVVDPAGQIVCNSTLTNPGLRPGCVPFNPFGPTAASAAAIDYVLGDVRYVGNMTMDDVTADISGQPFNTWAGPVNVALSGEWRRLEYDGKSNGTPTDFANCTGLRFNCTQGTTFLWRQTFPNFPSVEQSVKEVAFEFDAPLVKDVPLIQSFNLNGAVRYTSYDTSGDYTPWKVGIDWHVNDEFRFRGTQSRDIRAPTLNDLFAPQSVVIVNNTDSLTNTTPVIPSINFGNARLTAEIGKTTTLGFVWKPGWVPGLSLALDAYHITVSDAITTVQGFNPTLQQNCYLSGGTSPYCALQTRPNGFTDTSAANAATSWLVTPINIAEIETKGVDFEVNYATDLFGRALSLRGLAAYQPHIYIRQPAVPTLDQGGVAFGPTGMTASPEWRLTGFVNYQVTDAISVDVAERWRSPLKLAADDPNVFWVKNRVRSWATTSLNVGYDVKLASGQLGLFANIQNLFDQDPPGAQTGNNPGLFNGWPGSDDPTGRYYTVGVRFTY
jgi:outer membrane receptor protein involved in Fe transport